MGFLEKLRGIGHRAMEPHDARRPRLETPDPKFAALVEDRCAALLVRHYTDPASLESLGQLGLAFRNLQEATNAFMQTAAEQGVASTLPSSTGGNVFEPMVAPIIRRTREDILSVVPEERRTAVEGQALLAAQRQLRESLAQEGLSKGYRTGASLMLQKIEQHLSTDIGLTGKNPG